MAQRIMIVDDEVSFGEIGEIVLARAGYDVRRFESAANALKDLDVFRPDLVLSDVEMPEMDGFDFLRAIRKDPAFQNLPFILMSARRTYPNDRIQGLELGSDDYVNKPFSSDELILRVKAVLRRAGHEPPPPPPEAAPETLPGEAPALESYLQKLGTPKGAAAPAAVTAPATLPAHPAEEAPTELDPLPIFRELRRRTTAKEPTAVLLADMSFFRGYNECYGFEKGDEVLLFMTKCLENANQRVSGGKDKVSRLYADEFLALTVPERAPLLAQAALYEFSQGILSFYSQADLNRGFIEGKNRQGRTVATPFLNLTSAVVSNAERKLTHPGQFIHIGRELLAYAKTLGGSRYVQDRRRDPGPGGKP